MGKDAEVFARDPQAGWTKKPQEPVRLQGPHRGRARQRHHSWRHLSSADLHDSQAGPALIQGDDAALYADKAYDRKLRDALAAAGITDGIMHKARRNTPLKA